jgi:hypothetical protein
MKIWISDTKTLTHRLVKLNCDEHSDYKYLGDLSDDDIKKFFIDIKNDIDVNKNIRLLKYYGYLNLFVINKK